MSKSQAVHSDDRGNQNREADMSAISVSGRCWHAAIHLAFVCMAVFCFASDASAQQRFKTPEEAVTALVAAVRSDKPAEIVSVLGRVGRDIVLSGDDVADAKARATFLLAYDARHQLESKSSERSVLSIGPQAWPLPIPIVRRNGFWQFDSAAGREELLYRRIGQNELDAIQVVQTYVDAQNEYASINPEKAQVASYARRMISIPGKKDGLYWASDAGQQQSPLGEAVALATLEGYRFGRTPSPYRGYYYKILTGQGTTAAGGAVDYIVKDRMIGGFALVAYPAEYGNSGVMTFLVNHTGTIFQKDLGQNTSWAASRMRWFYPDQTWKRVPESDLVAK